MTAGTWPLSCCCRPPRPCRSETPPGRKETPATSIQPLPGKNRARGPAWKTQPGMTAPCIPLRAPIAGGKVTRFMVLLELSRGNRVVKECSTERNGGCWVFGRETENCRCDDGRKLVRPSPRPPASEVGRARQHVIGRRRGPGERIGVRAGRQSRGRRIDDDLERGEVVQLQRIINGRPNHHGVQDVAPNALVALAVRVSVTLALAAKLPTLQIFVPPEPITVP